MDYRPKCKMWNNKSPINNIRENLGNFEFGNDFLDTTPKAWSMKDKVHNLDVIKIKTASLWKTL